MLDDASDAEIVVEKFNAVSDLEMLSLGDQVIDEDVIGSPKWSAGYIAKGPT